MYLNSIKNIPNLVLDTHLVPTPSEVKPSKMHEFFSESLPLLLEKQTASSKAAAKEADADNVSEFVGQIFNYFG